MAELFIEPAQESDTAELNALIAESAYWICNRYYDPAVVAAAIKHIFGGDSQLIRGGCLHVARVRGRIIACGGWSPFARLFGADQTEWREDRRLDRDVDAARIRAFFVSHEWTQVGVGSALLETCEEAAFEAGFGHTRLLATLSGARFYEARGYIAGRETFAAIGDTRIRLVSMHKSLLSPSRQLAVSDVLAASRREVDRQSFSMGNIISGH